MLLIIPWTELHNYSNIEMMLDPTKLENKDSLSNFYVAVLNTRHLSYIYASENLTFDNQERVTPLLLHLQITQFVYSFRRDRI